MFEFGELPFEVVNCQPQEISARTWFRGDFELVNVKEGDIVSVGYGVQEITQHT